MTKQVEAVFEHGVLRPLEPLPFADNERLLLTVSDLPKATGNRVKELGWLALHAIEYADQWVALHEDPQPWFERRRGLGTCLEARRGSALSHPRPSRGTRTSLRRLVNMAHTLHFNKFHAYVLSAQGATVPVVLVSGGHKVGLTASIDTGAQSLRVRASLRRRSPPGPGARRENDLPNRQQPVRPTNMK